MYTFKQPGIYAYVNHNLIEAIELGAAAHFKVEGKWNDDLMKQVKPLEAIPPKVQGVLQPTPSVTEAAASLSDRRSGRPFSGYKATHAVHIENKDRSDSCGRICDTARYGDSNTG